MSRLDAKQVEIADGVFAYLQYSAATSWGFSNAGLVVGSDESLLVDTLFDLNLTRSMLRSFADITRERPIRTLVNTHANGDHCHGNSLLPDARIIASVSAAAEMETTSPEQLKLLTGRLASSSDIGDMYIVRIFGEFDFSDIEVPASTVTVDGALRVPVSDREVWLEVLGPAHTSGDVIAWVPESRVLFAGDLVFNGSTPIIWDGTIRGWIAACDRMVALDPKTIVPGHGPISDVSIVTEMRAYLEWLEASVSELAAEPMTVQEIAWNLELAPWRHLQDAERIVLNVDAALHELRPGHVRMHPVSALRLAGRYRAEFLEN